MGIEGDVAVKMGTNWVQARQQISGDQEQKVKSQWEYTFQMCPTALFWPPLVYKQNKNSFPLIFPYIFPLYFLYDEAAKATKDAELYHFLSGPRAGQMEVEYELSFERQKEGRWNDAASSQGGGGGISKLMLCNSKPWFMIKNLKEIIYISEGLNSHMKVSSKVPLYLQTAAPY